MYTHTLTPRPPRVIQAQAWSQQYIVLYYISKARSGKCFMD